jgi:streptogramin lyase
VATQQGVAASTTAKTVVTAAALAATAWARVLGKKVELASSSDPADAEKAARHPVDLDKTKRQLALAQWAVPALTGSLVILNALHGEQQRPAEQVPGMWERARSALPLG